MNPPIHESVARRWLVVRLASQAAAGAAIASGLALVLGAAPWLHLTAIFAGAAVAAAWPVRRDERRALRWVAEHAGLAYETAWDHARGITPAASTTTDPAVTLRAAVVVQARLSIRDLRPPPVSAWWLPLATLALGMWAWSLLGPGGGVGAPGAPATGATPPAPTAPAPTASDPLVPDDADAADEDAPLSPDDADAPGSDPGAEAGGDAAPGAAGAGGEGAPSERDALERFLENLRERPELSEEERLAAEARLAAEQLEDDDDASSAEGAADAELRPGDPRRDDGRDEPADGEEGAGDENGEGEGDDGSEGAGDERPGEGEEGEEGQEGEAGVSGEEDAGRLGEEGGDEEGAAGEDGPDGLEDGGEEGQAGVGIGAEGDAGAEADATTDDLEALPSILGPGPEQAIGGVQLPGVAPEGEVFPTGPAGSGYRRAVEQALSEGEVPVPYQEVIRNYFR